MISGPALEDINRMIGVGDYARLGAERCPDRAAIIMPEAASSISYAELNRRVDRAVRLLRRHGMSPGQKFGYLGKNDALFYVLLFAAIRGGFVIAPLNWRCLTAEIAYFLDDSAAAQLFCDPDFLQVAKAAVETLDSKPKIHMTRPCEDGNADFVEQLAGEDELPSAAQDSPASECLLLYTSGTSGRPKGALCTHEALSISRYSEYVCPDYPKWWHGSMVSAMPHFHIGGISWMLIGLMRQSTCVLTTDPSGTNIARLLRRYEASKTFAVPTVVRSIVEEVRSSRVPIPTLEMIFYGAAPIGESLLRDAMDVLGCGFGQYYGMTEITGSATFLAPTHHSLTHPRLLQSVGRVLPGVTLDIRDPEGRSVATGTPGEIWMSLPTLMAGYLNRPEATREAIVDGWFRTGDGGVVDADGFLFLTDRIKDMIVSGGENIYPAEVEEVLRKHLAVLDVAVVGRPDARWGEAVLAIVELRPGHSVNADELMAHAREQIAAYKCPKSIIFVETLPRTASGKIQRGKARETAIAAIHQAMNG